MAKVMIPIFEGVEEIEIVTIADVLRRAGITVDIIGLNAGIVTGSQGVKIYADKRFVDVDQKLYDAIVLPGGPGINNMSGNRTFITYLERYAKEGKLIGAICAAPLVLAKMNVLKDKRATCYPGYEKELGMPRDLPVVVDGNIVTSKGPGTAMQFSLKLVEMLEGSAKAAKIKAQLIA